MNPLQIAENLSAAGLDHPAVDDAVIKLTNMAKAEPFGHYFRDMAGNQHFHTGATPPSFAHSEITPLYAHPSRGVVDEAMVADWVRNIPVPERGFHEGWRDEEIWAWALREAAKLIHAALPAVPDGMVLVQRIDAQRIAEYVTDESTPGDSPAADLSARRVLALIAATPAHDQPEGEG